MSTPKPHRPRLVNTGLGDSAVRQLVESHNEAVGRIGVGGINTELMTGNRELLWMKDTQFQKMDVNGAPRTITFSSLVNPTPGAAFYICVSGLGEVNTVTINGDIYGSLGSEVFQIVTWDGNAWVNMFCSISAGEAELLAWMGLV
jgi:hypothetical protein